MERRGNYRRGSNQTKERPVLLYADVVRECAESMDNFPIIENEEDYTIQEPEEMCGRIRQIQSPVPDVSDTESNLQYKLASLHYKIKMRTGPSKNKEKWLEDNEIDSKYLLETINNVYNKHDIQPLSKQEWEDLIYHCEG